jgi:hypothetical protein
VNDFSLPSVLIESIFPFVKTRDHPVHCDVEEGVLSTGLKGATSTGP